MEIKVCTSVAFSELDWKTYQESFNAAFDKDYPLSYFTQKYTTAIDGHAYHALLLNNERNVVGGCSVIPFQYKKGEEIIRVGQAVDVFILEAYRADPMMLHKMYLQLKKLLILNGIGLVLAVPNTNAYTYWKHIVKWKDVGDLPYWMIIIRAGNVIKKWSFLNVFSLAFSYLLICFNAIISLITNNKERQSMYELITGEAFCNNRFTQEYCKIVTGDITFYYRLYDENGVKTAYLIDAKQKDRLSFKALYKGVSYIVRKTDADIVLYVGPMKLFQMLLIHVPKRFEPKRLPLTCDIINEEYSAMYSDILEFNNWNYGLLNFDVR